MNKQDCIFCNIINKEIQSKVVDETETILVINDLNPKAPIHYLIIPKKHLCTILDITDDDALFAFDLLKTARNLAQKLPNSKACNLISNNGKSAGQSIMHMHWHFLAGRNLYEGALSL